MMRSFTRALFAVVLVVPIVASAQTAADSTVRAEHRDVALLRKSDVPALLLMGAAVAAAFQADQRIQRSFQRPGFQSNSAAKGILKNAGTLGDPGAIVLSAGLYFGGLAEHSRPLAALGMHTGEAVVLGGAVAELIKGEAGRARPKISPTDSRVFKPGKGFSNDDFGSFPSAETTIAFAAATSLSREAGRVWPGHRRLVTGLSYGGAALVGISRLYNNEHWASDVATGAGIGIMSGVAFDRFNEGHPDNVFERIFLPSAIVPAKRGIRFTWTRSL